MFKIIAYLDQWEDVFVSEFASNKVRAFRGRPGLRNGVDGEIAVVELGRRESEHPGRPRLVQLFAPADPPWLAPLLAEHIERQTGSCIVGLLDAPNRGKAVSGIEAIVLACREIEQRIPKQQPEVAVAAKDSPWRRNVVVATGIALLSAAGFLCAKLRQVSGLDGEVNQLKTNMAGLEQRVTTLETQVKRIEFTLSTNNQGLKEWATNAINEWQRMNPPGKPPKRVPMDVSGQQQGAKGVAPGLFDPGTKQPGPGTVSGNK